MSSFVCCYIIVINPSQSSIIFRISPVIHFFFFTLVGFRNLSSMYWYITITSSSVLRCYFTYRCAFRFMRFIFSCLIPCFLVVVCWIFFGLSSPSLSDLGIRGRWLFQSSIRFWTNHFYIFQHDTKNVFPTLRLGHVPLSFTWACARPMGDSSHHTRACAKFPKYAAASKISRAGK